MPRNEDRQYEWEQDEWDVDLPDEPARPRARRERTVQRGGRELQLLLIAAIALSALLFVGRLLVDNLGPGEEEPSSVGSNQGQISSAVDNNSIGNVSLDLEDDKGEAPPAEPDAAEKLAYIMSNPDIYPERMQYLAQNNHETIDFVYQYPELGSVHNDIDLRSEVVLGQVPLLMQWDTRWGYEKYGDGLMGYTGCGPTCLSMVAIYLSGNPVITPLMVARYAEGSGYYFDGTGTGWELMSEGCEGFGLKAEELVLHDTYLIRALEEGRPLICAMGPGDFTDQGHFIVISGYEDGAFTVCDPNSRANSARTWTFKELKGQIKNIWAFSIP